LNILATILLGPGAELTVGDAIRSARPFVDGFVLVESGGGEAALDEAHRACVGADTYVGVYPWCGDYGDARQFALDTARRAGATHAVTLDPDERLLLSETFRAKLAAYPSIDVWIVEDRDTHYFKERVIRCAAPAKWHGRVCENIQAELVRGKLDGAFWELPKDDAANRRRYERGVIETTRMIAEGDDRFKWHRHRGSCLAGLGRLDEALEEYRVAVNRAPTGDDRAWVSYLVCEQLLLREEFAGAREIASQQLADHAGFLHEFGWILAYSDYLVGDDQNASRWAQLVLHCPKDTTRVSLRGMNAAAGCRNILENLHGQAPAGCVRLHHVNVPLHDRISEKIRQYLHAGEYETEEYRALKGLLRKTDRVLELGTGVGFLATYCAKRLDDGSRVLTVEADASMAGAIQATFAANDVAPTLLFGAVSAHGDPRYLERAADFWSTKTPRVPSGDGTRETVDGVTLDALVQQHAPTVLIVDIEGTESELAPTQLPGVRAVLIEAHSPEADDAVQSWLEPQGFTRRDVSRRVRLYERSGDPPANARGIHAAAWSRPLPQGNAHA
jgi:FkbM family methyltransferase